MIASFLGGLALFLYGQFLLERTLQKTSQVYLRGIIRLLTKYRGTAILAGSIMAVGMQSSTIPVFTLIGLINRGVLQLGQAVGIVLGASIGTTITVQAMSFDLAGYALWFIIVGFFISKIENNGKGRFLMALGFMFYGIRLIGSGVTIFRATSFGSSFLNGACTSPIVNMTGSFILTVLSQSTLAALAVGIVLIRDGGLNISCAIPIILGAHLGAGILPVIYSWKISGNVTAKQLGIANLLYRAMGVLAFSPLIVPLAKASQFVTQLAGAGSVRQLANAHTIFVLAAAALFYPLVAPYVKFIKKLIPEKRESSEEAEKNIGDLKKAEIELAEGVHRILKDSLVLWETNRIRDIDEIEKQGMFLRSLEDNVWRYMTGFNDILLDKKNKDMLKIIGNLGDIGDIVGNRLVDLAKRRVIQGLNFSIEGLSEVISIHKHIISGFGAVIKGLKDGKVSVEIDKVDKNIDLLISDSYKSHINRVCKGFSETKGTRLLHTDAVTLLEYIQRHVQKIALASL